MRRWHLICLFLLLVTGWLGGCTNTSKGISPDPTQIHYPIGIAVHPSGKFLYVANTNFDLAFTGGTVNVFSTTEDSTGTFDIGGIKTELKTLKMLSESTVEIGSFAGQIILNNDGTKAFVAVRQDRKKDSPIDVSSIIQIDIDVSKAGKGHLSCNETSISKEDTGGIGEEDKFETNPAPRCGDASKIFLEDNPFPYGMRLLQQCVARRTCSDDTACKCSDADKKAGLCTADQKCQDGQCVGACTSDSDCNAQSTCQNGGCKRTSTTPAVCGSDADCPIWQTCKEQSLLVTHLQTGGLSEITLQDTLTRRVSSIDSIPSGITSLALLPALTPLGGNGELILSSRQDNNLYILPAQLPVSTADDLLQVPIPHVNTAQTTSNSDVRGVVIGHDTKNNRVRLYAAVRSPSPGVLVYHLERVEGKLQAQMANYVPVGEGPSFLYYRKRPAPSPDLLYVVCSSEGRIDVINVETLQVIKQIRVGSQPYYMAFYEPKPGAEVQHRRAYVANFLTTTISIIDLNTHQVIGMVSGIDTRPPLP